MNKILVEVSVGELLDKLTILEIKKDKIKDAEKLKFINLKYHSKRASMKIKNQSLQQEHLPQVIQSSFCFSD